MNFNKVFVAGNLTRDPEVRSLPSGQTVVSFGVATNRAWTNQSGEKQEAVEFHNIVAFGKLADICSRYLSKGRLVLIEGRIQTRSWQGQDGIKRYRTEIITDNMQMGPRLSGASDPASQGPRNEPMKSMPKEEIPIIDAEEPTPEESTSSPNKEPEQNEETLTESEDKGQVEVKNIPF